MKMMLMNADWLRRVMREPCTATMSICMYITYADARVVRFSLFMIHACTQCTITRCFHDDDDDRHVAMMMGPRT